MYRFADLPHVKSDVIPLTIARRHAGFSPQAFTARNTGCLNSSGSYALTLKPVQVPLAGSYSRTVSASPPVARTTGIVPYRILYIWFSPQGSYFDGIRKISAPASVR